MVNVFLEAGSNPMSRDATGATPLHKAVGAGSERAVWALLNSRRSDPMALIDAVNTAGETALLQGYVMLWTRPPEAAVRAVATLSQVARAGSTPLAPRESSLL